MTALNWIGVGLIILGIISFSVDKEESYKYLTAILCLLGVIVFVTGFYIKKKV